MPRTEPPSTLDRTALCHYALPPLGKVLEEATHGSEIPAGAWAAVCSVQSYTSHALVIVPRGQAGDGLRGAVLPRHPEGREEALQDELRAAMAHHGATCMALPPDVSLGSLREALPPGVEFLNDTHHTLAEFRLDEDAMREGWTSEGSKLGEGGFGAVFGVQQADGSGVALKQFERSGAGSYEGWIARALRDLSEHTAVVATLGWHCRDPLRPSLAMTRVPGDDLFNILRTSPSSASRRAWATQLCDAAAYLEGQGIHWVDASTHNLMVHETTDQLVLVDLGTLSLSRSVPFTAIRVGTADPTTCARAMYAKSHCDDRDRHALRVTLARGATQFAVAAVILRMAGSRYIDRRWAPPLLGPDASPEMWNTAACEESDAALSHSWRRVPRARRAWAKPAKHVILAHGLSRAWPRPGDASRCVVS